MSTVISPRRRPRRAPRRTEKPREQESLFAAAAPAPAREAAAPAATANTAPVRPAEAPESDTTASARRQGPTLDDLVAGAWEGLLAGAPASCVVCGTAMHPRHSAGAGIVGGRCGGCGSTLG